MIRMARRKKIDLILCKSISRFARNTVDCLNYVRELKTLGVTVIFEKENINTSEISSEFVISLYASFAQAESESISRNVTWGIEKSFREGHVRYQMQNTLGYRLDENGRPVIIEEEAEIVREIFRKFADGQGVTAIAQDLTQRNVSRRNGQTVWTRNHVYQILKNEKYAGDAILQKTYTVNCLTHERAKNTGQKPMVFVQDCHDAIIDRQTYDTVRLELEKRRRSAKRGSEEKGTYTTRYCLSRLLICPYCGSTYKRTTWLLKGEKTGVWRCKNRMEGKSCSRSPSYHENVLHEAILSAVNLLSQQTANGEISGSNNFSDTASENLRIEEERSRLSEQLTKIENERDTILAGISGYTFESMSQELRELNRKENEIVEQLDALREKQEENLCQKMKAAAAEKLLAKLTPPEQFEDSFMDKILLKVEAVSKKEIAVLFYGGYKICVPIKKR